MFVPLTSPGRRAASAMLLLLGTSLATPALPQGAKARRAAAAHAATTTPPVAPAPAELRDGQAEARLMAVPKGAGGKPWHRQKAWRATTPTSSWPSWRWATC